MGIFLLSVEEQESKKVTCGQENNYSFPLKIIAEIFGFLQFILYLCTVIHKGYNGSGHP